MRHIKAAPLLRCRAAYFTFEKNHALYQRHCFSRSARTPRCNHCKARTGLPVLALVQDDMDRFPMDGQALAELYDEVK